ncbi:hypothetical protein GCM10023145_20750 [Angustibacter luteus]
MPRLYIRSGCIQFVISSSDHTVLASVFDAALTRTTAIMPLSVALTRGQHNGR